MTRFPSNSIAPAFLLTLAATLAAAPHPAAAQERTYAVTPVATIGEPAPGTEGETFGWFAPYPDLNNFGTVSFIGSSIGHSFPSSQGVWAGSPGALTLAARIGDTIPGDITRTFFEFNNATINNQGSLLVRGTTDNGWSDGLWVGPPGNLSPLVIYPDPVVGAPEYTIGAFIHDAIDNSGVSTFSAHGGSPDFEGLSIWSGTPDLLELVAISGQSAPGTVGQRFGEPVVPISTIEGMTAFVAGTYEPTFTNYADGIWLADSTGVNLVVLEGNPAPGAGGRNFQDLAIHTMAPAPSSGAQPEPVDENGERIPHITSGPILNQAGNLVFNAYLEPIDPLAERGEEGIWIQDSGGLRLITLAGDPAPGVPESSFLEFNHINFNALGQMAFDASLNTADPAGDHGIWMGLPNSLGLVVREGDPAPGTVGETFGSLIMGPSLNDTGEIAFYAKLRESGDGGVWAGVPGNLSLIARDGEAFEVKSGDYRVIRSIAPFDGFSNTYVAPNRFNAAGQSVFLATFTDRARAIIRATPVSTTLNQPPVANAGPDQATTYIETVTLSGTGSTDPEGTILSFVWSIDGVEIATGPSPAVGPFDPGTRTITLTVTDRSGASASDDMILTVSANLPPVANAGPDQTANHSQTITLDGTGSSDPEGAPISYAWSFDGADIGTGPSLSAGPFAVGAHTITLTVTDDHGVSASDSMVFTVINEEPVANAGPAQTVNHAQLVTLDGTGSSDPENGVLNYYWSSNGVLIATGATPTVGPFTTGTHFITLAVNDDHGAINTNYMTLTVVNESPVANAGPSQIVNYAQTAALDGTGSTDPEGGVLDYAWSINGAPTATGATPTVGPLPVGNHNVSLTVTDNHGATDDHGMLLSVINEAPVANAGPDQNIHFSMGRTATLTLDGSASSDPEGKPLYYFWFEGGSIISGAAVVQLDRSAGVYSFTLMVTDERGTSARDDVVVTVTKGNV